MKVYLEFDLQDKQQSDLYECALNGTKYREVIREMLRELKHDADNDRTKHAGDYSLILKEFAKYHGVIIG